MTFTPTDTTNYSGASATVTIDVTPAVLTVTADSHAKAYLAPLPSLTWTPGFVNDDPATVLSGSPACTTTATAASPAGSYPITCGAGTLAAADYTFGFVDGSLLVGKISPLITWPAPAPITYGTALATTQLNATADVEGTFAYSPAPGTVLHSGTAQVLALTFTPTDTTNYSGASATVTIDVTPAPLTITADSHAKAYLAPLPSLTCDPGRLRQRRPRDGPERQPGLHHDRDRGQPGRAATRSPAAPAPSPRPTTPSAFVDGGLLVGKISPLITWPAPAPIPYGTALSATQLNATADVDGHLRLQPGGRDRPPQRDGPGPRADLHPDRHHELQRRLGDGHDRRDPGPPDRHRRQPRQGLPGPAAAPHLDPAGFVNGDDAAVLSGSPACTTTATAASPVGSYPITCGTGTLAAADYTLGFVDGSLLVGYALSGILTGSNGTLMEGARIYLVNPTTNAVITSAPADVDGVYTLTAPVPGGYKLWINPNRAGYATQYHGGTSLATATLVTLSANTPLDITVSGPVTLSGILTGSNGTLMEGARIYLVNPTTNAVITSAPADVDGVYTLTAPVPGGYKLWINPNRAGYATQYHGGTSLATATLVTLSANTPLDITVSGPVTLSGILTGSNGTLMEGARIYLVNPTTNAVITSAPADVDGVYTLTAPVPGGYKLWINPNRAGYATQYHGGTSLATATLVTLSANTPLDITVSGPVTLSGILTGSNGTLMEGARIYLVNPTTNAVITSAPADVDGVYTLTAPVPGGYKLWINPNRAGYATQYHGGTSLATATLVTLSANTPLDITVSGPVTLSGILTGSNGTLMEGARIYLVNPTTNAVITSAPADVDGVYTLTAPVPGGYKLWINPNRAGYATQYHGGTSLATATLVTLSANTPLDITVHP